MVEAYQETAVISDAPGEPVAETLGAIDRFMEMDLKVCYDVEPEMKLAHLMSAFELVKTSLSARNSTLANYRLYFEGEHWVEGADEGESEHEYQLVINYCRRIVLDYVGMLARAPIPRVPYPESTDVVELGRARNRERLLRLVWKDFLQAWQRAESDASKLGFGVVECLWEPQPIESVPQPNSTNPSLTTSVKRYLKSPYVFRSIDPEYFYPVYRTYDRSDDFLYIFRSDPGRLATDLALRYNVDLQITGLDASGAEATADVVEYVDDKYYVLIAITKLEEESLPQGSDLTSTVRRALGRTVKKSSNQYTVLEAFEHGLGRIPFWVVQNIVDPHLNPVNGGSLSDLVDIFDLNAHLNEMRSEQAEEVVINIHRPLAYASDDHVQESKKIAFKAGAVIPIGLEEKLTAIAAPSQPGYVKDHIEAIEESIKMLSFLGPAGFGQFDSGTSGVAARISLTPLERILELKLPPRVYCLEGIGSFILRCFEKHMEENVKLRGWVSMNARRFEQADISPSDIAGQYYVEVDFGNRLPRDDDAHQQNEVYKHGAGTQSLLTTLENQGHDDPIAERERIKEENKDPYLNPEKWLAIQKALAEAKALEQPPQPPAGGGGQPPGGGAQPGAPAGAPAMKAQQPMVPPGQNFPRNFGFGAGSATPFLPRGNQPMGGQALPQMPAGQGIRMGGEG